MKQHISALATVCAAALVILGCGELSRVNPYDPAAPFQIDVAGPAVVQVGDTVTFSAETTPRWTRPEPPEWSSMDARVFKPLGGGRYVADGGGTTTIQVRFGPRYTTRAVTVESRAPTITSLSPNRAHADTGRVSVVLTGTDFEFRTTVLWDGVARPAFAESRTRMVVELTAADIAVVGTHTIVAVNPAPGGGSSQPAVFTSLIPVPRIRSFSPASATAGDPATTVALSGDYFTPQSTVRWNGSDRPTTYVSASRVDVRLSEADLAVAGKGALTVAQFGETSAPILFPVLPGVVELRSRITVPLPSRSVVWDSTRSRLYASVPATSPSHSRSIAAIDPSTGNVLSSIPLPGDPGIMVLSENRRYLYVAFLDVGGIVRVDLQTGLTDLQFALGIHIAPCGAYVAHDMVAVPGLPGSIAVVSKRIGCEGASTAVFDDGVMRPQAASNGGYIDRITGADFPSRLYAYGPADGLLVLTLDASGVRRDLLRTASGQVVGGATDIEHDGGYIFSGEGLVFDALNRVVVARLPHQGIVEPDVARGRVHLFQGSSVTTYNTSTLERLGISLVPEAEGAKELIRWGTDGLVLRRDDRIVIIRTTLAGP